MRRRRRGRLLQWQSSEILPWDSGAMHGQRGWRQRSGRASSVIAPEEEEKRIQPSDPDWIAYIRHMRKMENQAPIV